MNPTFSSCLSCLSLSPRSSLCASLALVLGLTCQLMAVAVEPTDKDAMKDTVRMSRCQDVQFESDRLGIEEKAQDEALTAQAVFLNKAPDEQKVALMAGLLTRMIEQQVGMREQRARLRNSMMAHMIDHMGMGQAAMAECPMMKAMKQERQVEKIADEGAASPNAPKQ